MTKWSAEDMPSLDGRTVVVTGANSGIGYVAAREFARKGAHVVLGCRSVERGSAAVADMERELGGSAGVSLELMELDLADLESVNDFVASFGDKHASLDVLVNNAGLMAIPRRETAQGFEMQLGVNHLGHFALTGRLMERLLAAGEAGRPARVVNVSSGAHRMGKIHFDDLQLERGYGKWKAYGQSKLANLLFTYELQQRLKAAGAAVVALGCHPGYAATNLQEKGPKMEGSAIKAKLMEWANSLLAQDAEDGALPTMYAATEPGLGGGEYIGPGGFQEMWGAPTEVEAETTASDPEVARRLWEVSEELTGVGYEFG